MEPSFEKKQTVKGVGQFLQLVGDSYYERYKKYWSKINTCSNITSILPLTETFQCLGKMARNIFVTRPRDECQSEVQLKTLEVVLSEGGDELARNMGELLQRAGDAMNEEYLSLSTSTSESNLNRLCFVLQCVKVLVHLSEFIWQIWGRFYVQSKFIPNCYFKTYVALLSVLVVIIFKIYFRRRMNGLTEANPKSPK